MGQEIEVKEVKCEGKYLKFKEGGELGDSSEKIIK